MVRNNDVPAIRDVKIVVVMVVVVVAVPLIMSRMNGVVLHQSERRVVVHGFMGRVRMEREGQMGARVVWWVVTVGMSTCTRKSKSTKTKASRLAERYRVLSVLLVWAVRTSGLWVLVRWSVLCGV